jgi:hypothetical protein
MPVCPKCGTPFFYTEGHVCEGRDKGKLWSLAPAAIGAVVGGPLGLVYGDSVIRQVCENPDAGNLCGLAAVPTVPFYIVTGAVLGASVATFAFLMILGRREA